MADILTLALHRWSLVINCLHCVRVEEEHGGCGAHCDLSVLSAWPCAQEALHPFLTLPSFLSSVLTSHPGCPAGWRRGPVAVENGCHDNGAQLYPFTVGASVSRPPPAGPHHADEGQHLCPRQLGVPAGNRHLPQPLITHCNHMLCCNCPIWAATLHNNYSPVAPFVVINVQVYGTTIK